MKTADEIIRDATRVKEFLADPIIEGAMSRMERRFYEAFIAADSSEKRVTAWAQATVLRTFETELNAVIGAGEVEVINAAKVAAQPKSR